VINDAVTVVHHSPPNLTSLWNLSASPEVTESMMEEIQKRIRLKRHMQWNLKSKFSSCLTLRERHRIMKGTKRESCQVLKGRVVSQSGLSIDKEATLEGLHGVADTGRVESFQLSQIHNDISDGVLISHEELRPIDEADY
jgi:hypothetical protein